MHGHRSTTTCMALFTISTLALNWGAANPLQFSPQSNPDSNIFPNHIFIEAITTGADCTLSWLFSRLFVQVLVRLVLILVDFIVFSVHVETATGLSGINSFLFYTFLLHWWPFANTGGPLFLHNGPALMNGCFGRWKYECARLIFPPHIYSPYTWGGYVYSYIG